MKAYLLISLLCVGCSTIQPISQPQHIPQQPIPLQPQSQPQPLIQSPPLIKVLTPQIGTFELLDAIFLNVLKAKGIL